MGKIPNCKYMSSNEYLTTDTPEGIDKATSLLYYSRMRFISQLLPLLTASPLPASCISIYAAGLENQTGFLPSDLSLRDPKHYRFTNVRNHATYMTTLYFEHLAKQYAGKLRCTHIYPGLVMTPAFAADNLPGWFKFVWRLVAPFAKWFATSAEDTGERMLFLSTDRFPAAREGSGGGLTDTSVALATDGQRGGGAYSVKIDGESNDLSKAYADFNRDDIATKVQEHTTKAFEVIASGGKFSS